VNFGLPNGVLVAGILATEFPASHTQFSAIIGMDVICLGDFAITNANGRSTISFRVPACEEIDYVLEAHRLTFRGTPRNAPCPWGSGKKFKHCHIDMHLTAAVSRTASLDVLPLLNRPRNRHLARRGRLTRLYDRLGNVNASAHGRCRSFGFQSPSIILIGCSS